MSEKLHQGSGADDRHGSARQIAEAALAAEREGDADRAEQLLDQAAKADPAAVIDVLAERGGADVPAASTDDDLATESETVVPGAAAPSRAGITGPGSGADGQGL